MSAGSFSYEPAPLPLSRPAEVVAVYRYYPEGSPTYSWLPNVACVAVQFKEGPEPPTARFRYVLDPLPGDGRPLHFEEIAPLDATGPMVVQADDRLAALVWNADGSFGILWEGFASVPQVDVGGSGQDVTFAGLGTPAREWDTPLGGATVRDSDTPDDATANTPTGLPIRFNPQGKPNRCPAADYVQVPGGDSSEKYPVFLDEHTRGNIDINDPQGWTLADAALYICAVGNPDLKWTDAPGFPDLADLLQSWEPFGDAYFDLGDSSTYSKKPIRAQDVDVTGMAWPQALWRLIEPHGFGMRWKLELDENSKPSWVLDVYRKDTTMRTKSLAYQPHGATLDPARTNVGAAGFNRDVLHIANRIIVDTAPVQYEASFVLAPGFEIAAADADAANLKNWIKGEGQTNTAKYRLFIVAEDGGPRWSFASAALDYTPTSLAAVLADPAATADDQESQYVKRPRPGLGSLATADDEGRPRRAELWISTDYSGPSVGVWNRSGTWQKVTSGGWKLLDDRLGIELTMADPESWQYADSKTATPVIPSSKARVVTALANPSQATNSTTKRIYFRLTCVIEGDRGLEATAEDRHVSPTSYTVTRRFDAKDKYVQQVIDKSSHFNTTGDVVLARDDTDLAKAHACAEQRSSEVGKFAGSVRIPRLTAAYQVGDHIDAIAGRGLSLRSNIGADRKEGPVYPVVVAVDYDLQGGQSTTLHLSDERARPARPTKRARGAP